MSVTFGTFFKEKRLALGITLREFCREHDLDAGNMSRIERGIAAPPKSETALRKYASALGIREGSEDWQTFMDLAAISAGRIPDRITDSPELLAQLPLVFRTMDGKPLSAQKLRELAEIIQRS